MIFLVCTFIWSTVWECLNNRELRVILSLQISHIQKMNCCYYNVVCPSSALKREASLCFYLVRQVMTGFKKLVQSTSSIHQKQWHKTHWVTHQPAKQFLMQVKCIMYEYCQSLFFSFLKQVQPGLLVKSASFPVAICIVQWIVGHQCRQLCDKSVKWPSQGNLFRFYSSRV